MHVNGLIRRLEESKQEITEVLVSGTPVNFESYHRLVGQYQGLDEALNIINELIKKDEEDVE